MNETRQLTEYLAGLSYDDLPQDAIDTAGHVIRDMLGVGLFASRLPWSRMAAEFAHEAGGPGKVSVWGRDWTTTAPFAALANGTAAHGIEMDERIPGVHNGSPTVAAAVAIAEQTGCSGKELILAVVVSYELAARVARATQGNAAGDVPNTANILGPAAAAAKLLKLDPDRFLNTIAIAGGTSCGVTEYAHDPLGTMVKRLQGGGWPAHFGVTAALLAEKGFTGPSTILEGKDGVLRGRRTEGEPDIDALVRGLGTSFAMALWSTKWYAAWGGSHSSIEAVEILRAEHDFDPAAVRRISLGIASRVLVKTAEDLPRSILAAQHHLPFIVGAAFYFDLHDPTVWQESILQDQRVIGLAARVEPYVDAEINREQVTTRDLGGSRMELTLDDGRKISTSVPKTRGSRGRPLTPEELESKFNMLSGAVLPQDQREQLGDLLKHLDKVDRPLNFSLTRTSEAG